MTLWPIIGAIAAAATVALLVPLLARPRPQPPRADYDLEIYRDQLAEVERDHARGLISEDQVEAARTEIARRMLAVDAAAEEAPRRGGGIGAGARRGIAVMVAVAVPVAALGLYSLHGAPWLSGMPAADVAARGTPAPDEDMTTLVARLSRRMAQRPDDVKGWMLLARSLTTLGRHDEAVKAYDHIVRLLPEDAAVRSLRGEALVAAGGGIVTAPAREAFDAALARRPGEPRAQFYLGLADLQAGNREAALGRWRALEAAAPPNAPWLPMLRRQIAQAAGPDPLAAAQPEAKPNTAAGAQPPAKPNAAATPPPRPSRDDVAAAAKMSPKERMAMIRGMVERLAARLADQPDDVEGWERLARSYLALGDKDKARDALAQVVRLRPDDVGALGAYAESMLETANGGPPPATFGKVIGDILRLDPDNRRALWIAGLMAAQVGSKDEARRFWSRLQPLLPAGSAERAKLDKRLKALGKGK